MLASVFITFLVLHAPVESADAQSRVAPQARGRNLPGPQIHANDARKQAIFDEIAALERRAADERAARRDPGALEGQIEQKQTEWREIEFGVMRPFVPLIAERWSQTMARLRLDRDRSDAPLTTVEAGALIDELFYDWGQPEANDRQQTTILHQMHLVLREGDVTDDVRRALLGGLLEFHDGGGGYSSPSVARALATGLAVAAGPADAGAIELAYSLRDLSRAWDDELQYGAFRGAADDIMDRAFERHDLFAAVFGPLTADANDSGGRDGDRLRKAVERMFHLLPKARQSVERLDEMRAVALDDYRSVKAHDGLLQLLLHFYRHVLSDPLRGGADTDFVRAIDKHLAHLVEESPVALDETESAAHSSRQRGTLRTKSHWEAWTKATVALGPRASKSTRRLIADRAGSAKDPTIRAALDTARTALARAEGSPKTPG
ncbi:MAG: hypothetical protein CHACPFDD_00219 [Phycisphaerae bacterium]|nr:hypothetical protein [Phycisphaerae bacterium]